MSFATTGSSILCGVVFDAIRKLPDNPKTKRNMLWMLGLPYFGVLLTLIGDTLLRYLQVYGDKTFPALSATVLLPLGLLTPSIILLWAQLYPLSGKWMILLGSGGHTGEMLRMLEKTEPNVPIVFLYCTGDEFSVERTKKVVAARKIDAEFVALPRAREVGQSWFTTVGSSIKTLVASIQILRKYRPTLLLLNGPGTSAILAWVAKFFVIVAKYPTKILYVESFARVTGLSLSGQLVYPIANQFIVQWETLLKEYPKAKYMLLV